MRYYALRDENGRLLSVGITRSNGIDCEISKAEYDTLRAEISEKAQLAARLYAGEITSDDVPAEWQEEIQSRVDTWRAAEEIDTNDVEISAEEALDIITGGVDA